jgi:hypothetical protein
MREKCFTKLGRIFASVRALVPPRPTRPLVASRRKLEGRTPRLPLPRTIHKLAAKGQISAPPERAVALESEGAPR